MQDDSRFPTEKKMQARQQGSIFKALHEKKSNLLTRIP